MRVSFPPSLFLPIGLPTFRDLFATFGFPPGVMPSTESLGAITTAILAADLPDPLARALHTVAAFVSEAARTDVYAAAEALGALDLLPSAPSPADLVARLLILGATDPRVAELLAAAKILRDRSFRSYASYLYFGPSDVDGYDAALRDLDAHVEPFRGALRGWCRPRGFGSAVSVTARALPGSGWLEVVHPDRRAADVVDGAERPSLTSHHPVRAHLLVYAPRPRPRLVITTDCPEAAIPLASLFGAVFFGNARHFLDAPAVDLWPLQEHGASSLVVAALSATLTMKAIGGTWLSGKGHALTPRGRDFFKALARYKIRIEGGGLDLVTLRARRPSAAGEGPATCDVVLRPPHTATVSEPELAPLVHDFLDRARITSPRPRPRDFFTLQPWILGSAAWVELEGRDGFDALVAASILVPDPSNRSLAPPGQPPHATRTATAYPLSPGKFLAWSPDPTIAPFVVEERDLVVYALAFAELASHIAGALGLESPATKLDDDGVLLCGRRSLGPTFVVVYLLTRPIRAVTAERLMHGAGHGHAIAICPSGRMQTIALRQIAMPKLAGPWRSLLGDIVRALHVEDHVETPLHAPEGARVVLHRKTMRVWIDGVACVTLTEQHFRLLEILIDRSAAPVHTKDIAAHIGRGSETLDTTRRTIESFVTAAAKSFKLAKKRAPRDLKTLIARPRHPYYALRVKGFVA